LVRPPPECFATLRPQKAKAQPIDTPNTRAADHLADGADLWRDGLKVDELLGDDGLVDPAKVTAAAKATTAQHPHWKRREAPNVKIKRGTLASGASSPADHPAAVLAAGAARLRPRPQLVVYDVSSTTPKVATSTRRRACRRWSTRSGPKRPVCWRAAPWSTSR
jgi:hypothetical protein